jgi:hypothetical protein
MVIKKNNDNTHIHVCPLYLFAKSTITREKYREKRLERFFDFLSMNVATQRKKISIHKSSLNKGNQWAFNAILRLKYLQYHLDRANRKEIAGSSFIN